MTGFIIAALFDSMLNVYILRCFTDLLYSVTKGLKRAVSDRAPDGKIRTAGARVISQSDSRILGSGGKIWTQYVLSSRKQPPRFEILDVHLREAPLYQKV